MKLSIFFCSALMAAVFLFCGNTALEARHHSRVNVNIGTTFVQRPAYGSYVVRPVCPQPVYVYPTYPEPVVVYPAPVYREVVPVYTPRVSLFSFGLNLFR